MSGRTSPPNIGLQASALGAIITAPWLKPRG
jgi:hypothetical protein